MKKRFLLFASVLFMWFLSYAQWEAGIGAGLAIPVTGYGGVLKSGWSLNGEGKYRLGKGNFAIGGKAHFTRLQKDKNPNDAFQNARMTVAPLLFTAAYGANGKARVQPYVTAGLGITFFNLNYDVSPTDGKTVFNVSFTMMPLIGFRYAATPRLYPFIESGFILIADGPPIGFPKADKITGYNSLLAGVQYRFR
jgi:hypothetical protein